MGKKLVTILGEQSGRMTALGLLVTLSVTMVLSGVMLSYQANAGALTSIKDTLSVSAPSSASNHTIQFTVTTAIPANGSISVDFDSGFTFGSVEFGDVDVASAGGDYTDAAAATGQTLGVTFNETAQRLLIALGAGNNIEIGEVLTIQIGTHATGGDAQITNPATTGSKAVTAKTYSAANATLDEGYTFVAIVNGVTLNAVVAASFTFVIDALLTGEAVDSYVITSSSEDSYVGFGTLTAGTPVTMGSSLSVSSNATNGFVVTVQQNHNMLASSGADIDCFSNGVCTGQTSAAYTAPTGTIGNELTYGHMGLTTEDSATISATASVGAGGTDGYFIGMVTGTPYTIWSYGGAADGVTQDIGHIDVGYRVAITALQEAGRYQSRLMYIATPTF